MTAKKNLWIAGAVLLVLGVVAAAIGQVATAAEMDAIDAAGPGGPGGTWLSLGGIATIVGLLLSAAGIIVLVIGIVRAARTKGAVGQPD
jgi:hypothetical protein